MMTRDLVKAELDFLREHCNFTDEEAIYFEAKARNHSNTHICLEHFWSITKLQKIRKRVLNKINKVLKPINQTG